MTVLRFSHKGKKNPSAKKRAALLNIIEDIKSGQVTDVQAMPAGNEKSTIDRIPSPLPFQKESSRDNINLDYVSTRMLRLVHLVPFAVFIF